MLVRRVVRSPPSVPPTKRRRRRNPGRRLPDPSACPPSSRALPPHRWAPRQTPSPRSGPGTRGCPPRRRACSSMPWTSKPRHAAPTSDGAVTEALAQALAAYSFGGRSGTGPRRSVRPRSAASRADASGGQQLPRRKDATLGPPRPWSMRPRWSQERTMSDPRLSRSPRGGGPDRFPCCQNPPKRARTRQPCTAADHPRNRAHDSIRTRRFSNRSLGAYAASALFLIVCASAASMTACGV